MVRISRARMNMEDGRIDRAAFKDYGEVAAGSSATVFTGTSYSVNIENYQVYELTLNANCSFTFANPTASGNTCSFTMILKQDQIGGWQVAWPTGMRWQGGVTPTLATAPGDFDVLTFFTHNGGSNWVGVQAARDHVNGVGTLWAWGDNSNGQLGLNDIAARSSPAQVGSDTNWAQVAVGMEHAAAVKTDGTLWTWGANYRGQLGANNITFRSSPAQVGSATNWKMAAAGWDWTLAVKTDGTLWGMGWNGDGQLGQVTSVTHRSSPTQIGTLTTWDKVFTGQQTSFAIKNDGTLWAWGVNTDGRLGVGNIVSRSSPTQVGALTTWKWVDGGTYQSIFLKTDGTLWATGNNAFGSLGDNTTTNRSSPVQVGSAQTWAAVTMGARHVAAVTTSGTLWTWGDNTAGQLGNSAVSHRSSPAQVGTGTTWSSVFGSFPTLDSGFVLHPDLAHTMAVRNTGTFWTWGSGDYGRLGNNATTSRSSPAQIGTRGNWRVLGAGDTFAVGLRHPPSSGGGSESLTYEYQSHYTSGTSSSSFSTTAALGPAADDRLTFVFVYAVGGSSTQTVTSMTIDGVSATLLETEASAGGTPAYGLGYALTDTGNTSGTVSVTYGGSKSNHVMMVISVYGADTASPISDSQSSGFGTSTTRSVTPTITTDGLILAFAAHGNTASTGIGWTNATEIAESNYSASRRIACAFASAAATITSTISSSQDWNLMSVSIRKA